MVLILWGSAVGIPGETWTFDLLSQKWTNQEAEPPDMTFQGLPCAGGSPAVKPPSIRYRGERSS